MYLGVEFLGHTVISCLTFWRIVKLCSKAATPFYIAIMYESSNFSTSMTMSVVIILIMVVPVYNVIFHYGFDLRVVMSSTLCVYWPLAYLLWVHIYSNSFLIWFFWTLVVLYIFWKQVLDWIYNWQVFSPLVFTFLSLMHTRFKILIN